jgi:hypothetical protein
MVAGSIASLKVALTVALGATSAAPSVGLNKLTLGAANTVVTSRSDNSSPNRDILRRERSLK